MNIPENFDRWMFDYLEGNLTTSEAETFEQFLLDHPEFEMDAEAWQHATIEMKMSSIQINTNLNVNEDLQAGTVGVQPQLWQFL
ncbi:MAG: hypothetical protein IT222_12250 [Crocinitomix sp.]|nr:hypothetical protein [Crocinitomix sp.]